MRGLVPDEKGRGCVGLSPDLTQKRSMFEQCFLTGTQKECKCIKKNKKKQHHDATILQDEQVVSRAHDARGLMNDMSAFTVREFGFAVAQTKRHKFGVVFFYTFVWKSAALPGCRNRSFLGRTSALSFQIPQDIDPDRRQPIWVSFQVLARPQACGSSEPAAAVWGQPIYVE